MPLPEQLEFFSKSEIAASAQRDGNRNPSSYRAEWALITAILACFSVLAIRAAAHRSLWFDEISTFTISSQPNLHSMFKAIPFDGNPPLYFLIERLFLALPVSTEVALRLPSVISWILGALLVYLFARRNCRNFDAIAAVCLYLAGIMEGATAVDARPYSLLLFFTLLAICAWQSAAFGNHKKVAQVVLTLSTAGAILTHQYGVIYVAVPIVAGELARSWRDRTLHLSLIGSMFIAWPLLLLTVPVTLSTQAPLLRSIKLTHDFIDRPRIGHLGLYENTLPPFVPGFLLFTLIVVALWHVVRRDPLPVLAREPRAEELCVAASLALLLPIMLLVAGAGTGYFVGRYAVGASIGTSLLVGLSLSHMSRHPRLAMYLADVTVVYSLIVGVLSFIVVRPSQQYAGAQKNALFLSASNSSQIVIADSITFSPTWWYSVPNDRKRVHYLYDLDSALTLNNPTGEFSLWLEQPYGAPHIEEYGGFLASHREFLLYCDAKYANLDWVKPRLLKEGWQLTLLGSEAGNALYRVTSSRQSSLP